MNEMRAIAERIPEIVARRNELAGLRPTDPDMVAELSLLEAQESRFDDMCMRHHRINLCQAGFVYGDVLRHPGDASVGAMVRLGDRVVIVEGDHANGEEIGIMEATRRLVVPHSHGMSVRDWTKDGLSLGEREDVLAAQRRGDRTLSSPASVHEASLEQVVAARETPEVPKAKVATRPARKSDKSQNDAMPDLFG